jgi:hypothetical protein
MAESSTDGNGCGQKKRPQEGEFLRPSCAALGSAARTVKPRVLPSRAEGTLHSAARAWGADARCRRSGGGRKRRALVAERGKCCVWIVGRRSRRTGQRAEALLTVNAARAQIGRGRDGIKMAATHMTAAHTDAPAPMATATAAPLGEGVMGERDTAEGENRRDGRNFE